MSFRLAGFADEAANDLEDQIRVLKENHIDLLEIRGINGKNVDELSSSEANTIRKRLDAEGISVWSIGSPFGKIGIGEEFSPHLESFKHSLELADILGAAHFRIFSFFGATDSAPVLERLGQFIDAARNSDVILCHENEKDIYGETAENCLEIHRTFPTLRAVFDPANYIQCGQDTVVAWTKLSPYVEYMHIKDALPDGSVVPTGKGIGRLPYLLSNYKGQVLTVEPHLSVFEGFDRLEKEQKTKMHFCYPDPKTAFTAAVDALRETLGRIEEWRKSDSGSSEWEIWEAATSEAS